MRITSILLVSIFLISFVSAISWSGGTTTLIGTGNVTNFTDLGDVPNSYVGEGGNCVAVVAGETGLEFVACAAATGSIFNITYDQFAYNQSLYLENTFGQFWYNHTSAANVTIWETYNDVWLGTFNATYDSFAYNQTQAANLSIFTDYDERWSNTFNVTYNNSLIWAYNQSTGAVGNASFNQSLTDDLYVNEDGDNMTGNLNLVNANITANGSTTYWRIDEAGLDAGKVVICYQC